LKASAQSAQAANFSTSSFSNQSGRVAIAAHFPSLMPFLKSWDQEVKAHKDLLDALHSLAMKNLKVYEMKTLELHETCNLQWSTDDVSGLIRSYGRVFNNDTVDAGDLPFVSVDKLWLNPRCYVHAKIPNLNHTFDVITLEWPYHEKDNPPLNVAFDRFTEFVHDVDTSREMAALLDRQIGWIQKKQLTTDAIEDLFAQDTYYGHCPICMPGAKPGSQAG